MNGPEYASLVAQVDQELAKLDDAIKFVIQEASDRLETMGDRATVYATLYKDNLDGINSVPNGNELSARLLAVALLHLAERGAA